MRDSPLSVNLAYAMTHPLWMLDFLSNCKDYKVARIIRILGKLLKKTYEGLDPLIEMTGSQDLLKRNGAMYLYRNQQEYEAALPSNQARQQQEVEYTEVNAGEIRELEPHLKLPFERGLLFEKASQVLDPKALCERYFDYLQRNGSTHLRQRAVKIQTAPGFARLLLDNGETLQADRIVVAAGAFSKSIHGISAGALPLDTERGYHIQYSGMQQLANRPLCWNAGGFYATPTNLGLRFAGTVEIAGYRPKKNPRNLHYLRQRAQQMFDLPDQPDSDWLGFRPTFPDALPVIGYSPVSEFVLVAFGHHHLGLTLAGITGKLIAELANGEPASHNIKPFRAQRFF